MIEFALNKHDYIALNQLLKSLNLVESGGMAKMRIQAGEVRVNDAIETQVRKKLRSGDRISIDDQEILIQ